MSFPPAVSIPQRGMQPHAMHFPVYELSTNRTKLLYQDMFPAVNVLQQETNYLSRNVPSGQCLTAGNKLLCRGMFLSVNTLQPETNCFVEEDFRLSPSYSWKFQYALSYVLNTVLAHSEWKGSSKRFSFHP